MHSQTVSYMRGIARAMRGGRPAGLRAVDQGDRHYSSSTSRVREHWRQRVQAPPKQLIATRRPVCLPQQQPGFP
jgi:hypothetical protein